MTHSVPKQLSKCGCDHVAYFFQGGGALGSYQVGVFTGLFEAGYFPNWLSGTSIGAINASIIAGNPPEEAIKQLKEFWKAIATPSIATINTDENLLLRRWQNFLSAKETELRGQKGFFTPRIFEHPTFLINSTPDKISFYDTTVLRSTLEQLIDFDRINREKIRLSLSAVEVVTGERVFFDNTKQRIGIEHVMASCALPPGFPAVLIEGKYYWDGGLTLNTPIHILLDDSLDKTCLCFSVQLFDSYGLLPTSLDDVLKRKKDITFATQYRRSIQIYSEMHNLRRAIHLLLDELSEEKKNDPNIVELEKLGQANQLNLVRFHYKGHATDLSSKDYDFSERSIMEHMENGYNDVLKALKDPPWLKPIPETTGIVVHEVSDIPVHHKQK